MTAKTHGPYLIYTDIRARFFVAAGANETHGHWQHEVHGATFYEKQDDAERAMRSITSKLTRHHTSVVPVGVAHKLAAKYAAEGNQVDA